MIYLDASSLTGWRNCREFYRQRNVLMREQDIPNIYYEFGKLIHLAVEEFWKGSTQEIACQVAYRAADAFPVSMLTPPEADKWRRQVESIPDLMAVYYDGIDYEPENILWVEQEFAVPYNERVTICGKIDRIMKGPHITDVKTASEIGTRWKQDYREGKLLDIQLGLYDWYQRSLSNPPVRCTLEVIVKPYKTKPARLEILELPEILTDSYRKRFDQQLAWMVSDIEKYQGSNNAPWPMAGGHACQSKFSKCPYWDLCIWGELPKVLKHYKKREWHLQIVNQGENLT